MAGTSLTQEEKTQRGASDAGRYFREMVDFVGFTPDDAATIRESSLIIEKHIPAIVADFYTHLLRYPPTRVHFLQADNSINLDYLQKRMHHLTNFWRRTAQGSYDDDYARYIDYVGLAHTSHGADPKIYIAERYVIGQVGFMQRAISKAISDELYELDPDLERRANRAWNLLMMVILEMLSRAYETSSEAASDGTRHVVDPASVQQLAVETYERGLGLLQPLKTREVLVGSASEIPEGSRKIIQVDDLSIGIFHHKGEWVALRNHCLHAGGPVATGPLEGDTLTCPWHGFRYCVLNGELLIDPALKLESYEIILRDEQLLIKIPDDSPHFEAQTEPGNLANGRLKENEFSLEKLPVGAAGLVYVSGQAVAVYHTVNGYYAISDACTHAAGPLSEGKLEGGTIVCPWHGSCFDLATGEVLCGPAQQPVRTYKVILEGPIGRVE